MKYTLISLLLTLSLSSALAQHKNTDSTARLTDKRIQHSDSIKLNPQLFIKSSRATVLVKSKKCDMGLYIDSELWQLEKTATEKDVEFDFTLKDTSIVYVYFSPMKNKNLSLEEYAQEMYEYTQRGSTSPLIIEAKEYRMVNGLKVLYVKFKGMFEIGPSEFAGYFYSDSTGTMRLICAGLNGGYKRNEEKINAFLNGLVKVAE